MAMLIRQQHRLLAIRVGMALSRSDALVELTPFHGKEQLCDPVKVPAEILGIRRRLHPDNYGDVHFQLPESLMAGFRSPLGERRRDGEPIWLQLDRSWGQLAVVPWERLLVPALGPPVLRIPNFLGDPIFLEGRLVLAICASSPKAKSPFSVPLYVGRLIEAVQHAVPRGSIVHVFADHEAYSQLRRDASQALQEVVIHDPSGAASFGVGPVDPDLGTSDGRLRSPWLRWIRHQLQETRIDAVHFIGPGYFANDRGALALARSPIVNEDRDWSHFVGASELHAFLDLLGAWSIAFSSPLENVWAIGLRLLAEQLAWARPEPLLLHEADDPAAQALEETYRFLYGPEFALPPQSPDIALYCHPKRLKLFAKRGATFESATGASLDEDARAEIPALFARPSRAAASAAADVPEPTWRAAARLGLEHELRRLPQKTGAVRQGAEDALAFLTDLLAGTESSDSESGPSLDRFLKSDSLRSAAAGLRNLSHKASGGDS